MKENIAKRKRKKKKTGKEKKKTKTKIDKNTIKTMVGVPVYNAAETGAMKLA